MQERRSPYKPRRRASDTEGINHQRTGRNAVQPKMRGGKAKIRGVAPLYPYSAERELRRVNRACVRALEKPLKAGLHDIINAYEREMRGDQREDGIFDFLSTLHGNIMNMASSVALRLANFAIEESMERISRMVQKTAMREWAKMVKKAIGVGAMEEFYRNEQYEQLIRQWISENSANMSAVPRNMLLEIERTIADGYRSEMPVSDITDKVQDIYDRAMRGVELSARDQVSTLNAKLTKMIQQDAGITKYIWYSSRDGLVRDCHQEFDGNEYTWDEPPEDWYVTKSRGIVYTGERFHPGEAYGCRCLAVPVFDIDGMKLPIGKEGSM